MAENNGNSTRIPNWVMPVILAGCFAVTGWTFKKMWDISDQVLKNGSEIAQHDKQIQSLQEDHNVVIEMSTDLRSVKDNIAQMNVRIGVLNDQLDRRPH